VILDPVNDGECLGQLTTIARELVPTTVIQSVARRLSSREAIVRWFQSLPQANDTGQEPVRFIQCDVPQRARLLPDDPNCVERATGAMMLLEVVDPKTPRALATVEKPARHTGLVEKHGARWYAVDLFPRRNASRDFDWGNFGRDVLQGVHKYVGKPLLGAYGAGAAADWLGDQEDSWIGRGKKQPEKKQSPPSAPKREPSQAAQSGSSASSIVSGFIGPGASKSPKGQGGKDAQAKDQGRAGGAAAGTRAADAQAVARDRGDSHDQGEVAQRFWWLGGR
jgi:hypothetical protein